MYNFSFVDSSQTRNLKKKSNCALSFLLLILDSMRKLLLFIISEYFFQCNNLYNSRETNSSFLGLKNLYYLKYLKPKIRAEQNFDC